MARKMMTKEVTTSVVKFGKVLIGEDGLPKIEMMEPVTVIGGTTLEKAQVSLLESNGAGVTVLAIESETVTYEMAVEDFIKVAKIRVPETGEEKKQREAEEAAEKEAEKKRKAAEKEAAKKAAEQN